MIAVASWARSGWSLALVGSALVVLWIAREPARFEWSPPKVICMIPSVPVEAPPIDQPEELTIPGTARYVAVDLDGCGENELVVRAESRRGPVLVVVRPGGNDRSPLAELPLLDPARSPCASDFTVDDDELVVDEYVGESCRHSARRTYRLINSAFVATRSLVDNR